MHISDLQRSRDSLKLEGHRSSLRTIGVIQDTTPIMYNHANTKVTLPTQMSLLTCQLSHCDPTPSPPVRTEVAFWSRISVLGPCNRSGRPSGLCAASRRVHDRDLILGNYDTLDSRCGAEIFVLTIPQTLPLLRG